MARTATVRFLIIAAGLLIGLAQGCADQGEGERCEPNAAGPTADCESGLTCVPGEQLADRVESSDYGRCCPDEGKAYSDSRCARVDTIGTFDGGFAGEPGLGGAPGLGGSAGEAAVAGAGGQTLGTGGVAGAAGASGAPSVAGAAGVSGAGGLGGQSGAGTGGA